MSNILHQMDVLFPGTRQRVLAVLLLEPDQSFHLRELARLTACHAGTLAREVEKLAESGLLQRRVQGNQVRYQADRTSSLFHDLSGMFRKTHGATRVLRDALAPLHGEIRFALTFGSMARGRQSPGSDVDVLLVGDVPFADVVRAFYPARELLAREINPVVLSFEEFRTRAQRGDAFLANVLRNEVVMLLGDLDALRKRMCFSSTPTRG